MRKRLLSVAVAATAALAVSGCTTAAHDTAKSVAKVANSPSKSVKPAKPKGPSPEEKKWTRYTNLRDAAGVTESVIGDSRDNYVDVCQKPKKKVVDVITKADYSTQKMAKQDVMAFVAVYCGDQTKGWKSAFAGKMMSYAQYNAVRSAQEYLATGSFSKAGLIDQLSSKAGEGFSHELAVFAVNHVKVNWFKQAAKSAKQYLDMGGFSRDGLIQQLESSYGEQFTHAQAVYGVNKAGL